MKSEKPNLNKLPDTEQQLVLFKYKRAYHEEVYDQIKIHTKKIKPNPENTQNAVLNYKKTHFLDREAMLQSMFQKLQLNQKQPQSPTKNQDSLEKSKNQSIQFQKPEYFLKRINLNAQDLALQSKQQSTAEIRNQAKNIKMQARKMDLQQKFNKIRGINSSDSVQRRIKYKIIDIRQQNMVDFNGQKFEYQDLSKQYSTSEIGNAQIYDYYVLTIGKTLHQNHPQIILPQQAEYLLSNEYNDVMKQQTPEDSEEDSNRQDRSDYDYPEQDYHEEGSDQSEDIICGRSSEDGQNSDENDLRNSYRQEDEEEYYRQYLKRCRRKEQGDDELTYLYNLRPAKYDEDSDD